MNLLLLFVYSTSARYEIRNEELTVSPWPAMAIVTGYNWTKVSVGWSTEPARLGGWHFFGEDSFMLFSYPTGILLSGWFSILKICNAF
jgi:hypothetical protein